MNKKDLFKGGPENVTINFNTFQVNLTEEDEEKQKEKLEEYGNMLKEILKDLPTVSQSYDTKPNGDKMDSKYSKYYDMQYNKWHEALQKASNVVMTLLQRRPLKNDYKGINQVIIYPDEVMFRR